jgi:hypothetical protein
VGTGGSTREGQTKGKMEPSSPSGGDSWEPSGRPAPFPTPHPEDQSLGDSTQGWL